MGEEIITEKKQNKTRRAKEFKHDELSLYFIDGRVFVLISTGTANNRLCCAIINNKLMYASSLDREEIMSSYTG